MSQLIIEGLPAKIRTSPIFRWILDISQIKKQQIGKIEILHRTAIIDIDVDELVGRSLVKELQTELFNGQKVDVWYCNDDIEQSHNEYFKKLGKILETEVSVVRKEFRDRLMDSNSAQAKNTSTSLVNLIIVQKDYAVGSRIVLMLSSSNPHNSIPYTRLRVGSPIVISAMDSSISPVHGIVSYIKKKSIEVTLNYFPELDNGNLKCRLDLSDDEVGSQRERMALIRVKNAADSRLAELRGVLVGDGDFLFTEKDEWLPRNKGLNDVQWEAVRFAISAKDIALIHGPPGTGKTTVVTEIIRQSIQQKETVLACAPSNLAVDNLFEQLLNHGVNVIRIGHPARLSSHLRQFSLDGMVADHKDLRQARKLILEAESIIKRLSKSHRSPIPYSERKQLYAEVDDLRDQARKIEDDALQSILDAADVVCSTLHGVDALMLGSRLFDVLIIDEACQATEPSAWIPIIRSKKVILAGDFCQLPPTVISEKAIAQGLNISLLEKLIEKHGKKITRQLTIQYRMNKDIMGFSSQEFYNNLLVADRSVFTQLLSDSKTIESSELTNTPVHFIDTSGMEANEEMELDGTSLRNPMEAQLIRRKIVELFEYGILPGQITVLSPYSAQVKLLTECLQNDDIEIVTIDGFQGRENDVIIISFVRSNRENKVGFLGDIRRMNVALTRARCKLIVVGDSATIISHPFYERMLDYFDTIGAYHGFWEEDL